MKLMPNETELKGTWTLDAGKMVPDDSCTRIESLISDHLKEVGCDSSGWDKLFQDPNDGRYWELLYLNSEMAGGGPPTLRVIAEDAAREKYEIP